MTCATISLQADRLEWGPLVPPRQGMGAQQALRLYQGQHVTCVVMFVWPGDAEFIGTATVHQGVQAGARDAQRPALPVDHLGAC